MSFTELDGFMPGAIIENDPPGENDPRIVPCGVIGHIAVSLSDDIHPDGSGVEWHFYVTFTGVTRQYRSIWFEADANADGNSFVLNGLRRGFVSIETQGVGEGQWTDAQLAAIRRIILWVREVTSRVKGIVFPLTKCQTWNDPGIGYHRQFTEWNPHNHSCPGDARVIQFNNVLLPSLKESPEVTTEEMQTIANMAAAKVIRDGGKILIANPFDPTKAKMTLEAVLESLINRTEPGVKDGPTVTTAMLTNALLETFRILAENVIAGETP